VSVRERIERAFGRSAPVAGIRPVPTDGRSLSGFDLGILWGDLAIGLLVALTGALLVPALGLPKALAAIAVGSLIGCVPLALVGYAGAREGVPGMVLFRPVLGRAGSSIPSVLNVLVLIGWTGFELWAMALVAERIGARLFGFDSFWLWLALVSLVCTGLALGGPIVVIRRWLERFGAWLVAAVGLWITYRLFAHASFGELWRTPGTGGLPFWLAVDLVIAQPVSWLALVADYNRFARDPRSSAVGTFVGYAVGNAWFYALGALLVLGAGLTDATPAGLAEAVASLAGGWIVLVVLLVGETDEAFADVYSAAVSTQNLWERVGQRRAIVVVAACGVGLAAWLGRHPTTALGTFESFLFLLGSVFVPGRLLRAAQARSHRGRAVRRRHGRGRCAGVPPDGVRGVARGVRRLPVGGADRARRVAAHGRTDLAWVVAPARAAGGIGRGGERTVVRRGLRRVPGARSVGTCAPSRTVTPE
jgi:putative hydroxymethylpyrimidine transporter CytX